jgi:hypothetical protein
MTTPGVKLVIQSGIIPKETLEQLVKWKLLPKEALEEAGSRKASLEADWSDAAAFVGHLDELINKEAEAIRESEFTLPGELVPVTVKMIGQPLFHGDAYKDRMGRIFLGGRFYRKGVQAIQVGPGAGPMKTVVKVEERFVGDRPSWVVCYLED